MQKSSWSTAVASMVAVVLPFALSCDSGQQDTSPGSQGQPPARAPGQQSAPRQQAPQGPPQAGPSAATEVSDEELRAYTEAYLQVTQVRGQARSDLQETQDSAEMARIRQDANDQMRQILEDHGISPRRVQAITRAIQGDSTLQRRFQQMRSQIQGESGGGGGSR